MRLPASHACTEQLRALITNADRLDDRPCNQRTDPIGRAPLAETHEPMVNALKAAGAERVESVVYDDDHPFSAQRIVLARKVTVWRQAAMPARVP